MKLWNKNFTILVVGSFISALGSVGAGVGLGILLYKNTGSPLALAFFTVANIIPRVITNFLVGPYIDRNSRKKVIVALDFAYSVIFAILAAVLFTGYFNVIVFTAVAALFGILDTIYQTAFMSMFPEVIPKGFYSKAYSLSSLIWPLSAAIMAPIAALMIENFTYGVAILLVFNAITFFITASMEATINIVEILNEKAIKGLQFLIDLKEGIKYYGKEKGILGIGLLFSVFSFLYASHDLLRMPYFIEHDIYTIQHFSFLITAGAAGRIVGGIVHYLFKYPTNKKYIIAVSVYFSVEIMSATMLFMPYFLMITVSFIVGLLSVTSFNIRMSSTQAYIPQNMRGRVNSTQQLLWNVGAIIGVIVIGVIAEYTLYDYRYILLYASSLSLIAIILIPVRMKEEFKKIYNTDN